MRHLGANVYLWDRQAQNRFLARCVEPALGELRSKGLVRRFWFDRFDARGPHLFLLFTAPSEAFPALRERLSGWLATCLRSTSGPLDLAPEEAAERHRQTRGKVLCEADTLPGLAEEGSFLLFEQSPGGYPFRATDGLAAAEDFWCLLDALSLWTLGQVEKRGGGVPTAAGVRWAAALDQILQASGIARDYWRYHAATLLLGLEGAGSRQDGEVLEVFRKLVGAGNARLFSRLWDEVESAGAPWPHCSRLVDIALSGIREDQGFPALRHVAHSTWKQLGIPVDQQIPLVLFAWTRDRCEEV